MRRIFFLLMGIFMFLPIESSFAASPQHSTLAKKTIRILKKSVTQGTTMFGHQDDLLYGTEWCTSLGENQFKRSDTYSVAGYYPMVLGLELGRLEKGGDKNLDGVLASNIIASAITHYKRGGIITITWHCDNPVTGGNAWVQGSHTTVEQIFSNKDVYALFITYLDNIANIIDSMRTGSGRRIPILFRPWHECNLDFWWGGKNVSDQDYIRLWKLTYDVLVCKHGLKNLIWVYSPYDVHDETIFFLRYPGDEYVDVFGFERYQLGENEMTEKDKVVKFSQVLRDGIDKTWQWARKHKKIAAITETGYLGVKYENWWTEGLLPILECTPCAYLLTWRNGYGAKDYAGPTLKSCSANDFKTMSASPKVKLMGKK